MKLLEIENLKKSFEDLDVLHDISLGVEEGEVVAIIGPSGSGKSTLLRCCTGLEQADSGMIHYEGSYGLVFQNFNLFPHYSVLKNIMDAPVSVQKQSKKEAEKEARRLLEKMGLGDKADAYPCQLSGGQQQRVAIARALALKPSILFFDEPSLWMADISLSRVIQRKSSNTRRKNGPDSFWQDLCRDKNRIHKYSLH